MNYNEFLFSQLWMVGKDGEYDLMYGEMLKDYTAFELSTFNNDDFPYYECVVNYLAHTRSVYDIIKSEYLDAINKEEVLYPNTMCLIIEDLKNNKYISDIKYVTATRLMQITKTDSAYDIFNN